MAMRWRVAFMSNHRSDLIIDPPHIDGVGMCKDWNLQWYVGCYVEWETVLEHKTPFQHLKSRYLQK